MLALAIDSGLLFSGADTSVTGFSLGGGAEGVGVALDVAAEGVGVVFDGGAQDADAALGGDRREGSISVSAESFSTKLLGVAVSTKASAGAADTCESEGIFCVAEVGATSLLMSNCF